MPPTSQNSSPFGGFLTHLNRADSVSIHRLTLLFISWYVVDDLVARCNGS
jgi:hypothetical protein